MKVSQARARTFSSSYEYDSSYTNMDEIKRLQAEFQKAQESGAVSKLSERNMVQVCNRVFSLTF